MMTDVVVKILAVVGGGVGGGLALGLLAQLLIRAVTVRKPPRWSIVMVRLLGGVICGWLVALWLFGGGGPGIGGTGGWGFGSGSGKGEGEKAVESGKKDGDGKAETPAGQTLRIEVLGNAALSPQDIQQGRRYRLNREQGPLLTFAEIKEMVRKRQQEQPSLRYLEIILYKDSPAEGNSFVSQLESWARDLNGGKMTVKTSKSNADAPKK